MKSLINDYKMVTPDSTWTNNDSTGDYTYTYIANYHEQETIIKPELKTWFIPVKLPLNNKPIVHNVRIVIRNQLK